MSTSEPLTLREGELPPTDMKPSGSVTKVQELVHVNEWTSDKFIAKASLSCFFSYKKFFCKRTGQARKRPVIMDCRGHLIVYETNCTGYVFDLTKAHKVITKNDHGSCVLKVKFKFGAINFLLTGVQVSEWRNLLMSAYENTLDFAVTFASTRNTSKVSSEEDHPCSLLDTTFVEEPEEASKSFLDDITEEDCSEKSCIEPFEETPIKTAITTHPNRSWTTLNQLSTATAKSSTSQEGSVKSVNLSENKSVRQGATRVATLRKKIEEMNESFNKENSFHTPAKDVQMTTMVQAGGKSYKPMPPVRPVPHEYTPIQRQKVVFKAPPATAFARQPLPSMASPSSTFKIVSMTSTSTFSNTESETPTLPVNGPPRPSGVRVFLHKAQLSEERAEEVSH